jgi:hypothetical protein
MYRSGRGAWLCRESEGRAASPSRSDKSAGRTAGDTWGMKMFPFSLLGIVVAAGLALAQVSPPGVVPGGTVTARDGFTKHGTAVLVTRNGMTQKVEKEMAIENGLRVRADGSVTLPSGEKATLCDNQLLTFSGAFEDVALSPQGTAPMSSVVTPAKKVGEEVGVSATDGVTISSGAVMVTRNGVMERLAQDLKLANGTRVQTDGTVTYPDGRQITLRGTQVLTFEGLLLESPARTNPAPAGPRDGGLAPAGVTPSSPR